LEAVNFESNHPISEVEFWLGTNQIGATVESPHVLTWTAPWAGDYPLWVQATNSLGELRTSAPVPLRFLPPNDDFARAAIIPSSDEVVSVEGSTAFATHEGDEPLPMGGSALGSIWFTWRAPFSGSIFVSREGSQSAPFLVVYRGTTLTNLVMVKDPWADLVPVAAGEQYAIAADALWGNQGHVRITIYPPPPNDDFANAFPLSGVQGTVVGTNYSASAEPGEPVTDPVSDASLWWRWTAPATGDLRIGTSETYGMTVETGVFVGYAVDALQAVASPRITSSRNAWGSGTWWDLLFRVRRGETYHFRFSGGQGFASRGILTASYSLTVPPDLPPNDDFASRASLQGGSLTIEGNNAAASNELGEPALTGMLPSGKTLWWAYPVPEGGMLRLQISGSNGTPFVVAAWAGDSLNTLTNLGWTTELPLLIPVVGGQRIQISVDGAFGQWGGFTLHLDYFSPPLNDDFEHSQHLTGTTVVLAGANYGATSQPGEPRCSPDASGRTLWYSWVAPATGRVTPLGGAFFIRKAVYVGPDLEHLNRVNPVWPSVDFAFLGIKDTVYHLQIDTEAGSFGDFSLTLSFEPLLAATNDAFTNAIPLASHYATTRGSLLGATTELGEPAHMGDQPCGSIWWSWQAPFNGGFWWETEGSLVTNLVLSFYQGSSVEALTLVTRSASRAEFQAAGGEMYYLAVAVPPEVIGDAWLRVTGRRHTGVYSVPGNLLLNPSFENEGGIPGEFLAHWTLVPGGYNGHADESGADGAYYIAIPGGSRLSQDVPTTPGHSYRIRLATFGQTPDAWTETRVYFGDQLAGTVAYQTEPYALACFWHWGTFTATATSTVTRLVVHNLSNFTGIDGLSVVPLDDPPTIVTSPRSLTAYAGSTVTFVVGAIGPGPLAYQWFFGTNLLVGATNKLLVLDSVSATNAGPYSVQVSNAHGAVTSNPPAWLTLNEPDSPVITLQPWGDTAVAGQYHVLTVSAQGTPPLLYQWYRDGQALNDATNRTLVFPAIAADQSGTYWAEVANHAGSVLSLHARLYVSDAPGPGVQFSLGNWHPDPAQGLDAPVFDVDNLTRLAGDSFLAQLYAGPSSEQLRPCGLPWPFETGFLAGYVFPVLVEVPSVVPGADAYLQLRAWEAGAGSTYEEARAVGGRFGRSAVLCVPTSPDHNVCHFLTGLERFHLETGLPRFNVGRLEAGGSRPDGTREWRLIGEAGFRYLVEKSLGDFRWRPLLQVSNVTGIVTFVDSTAGESPSEFYRARILD
jgi:hypothetical protein